MSPTDLLRAIEDTADAYADAVYDEAKQRAYITETEGEISASLLGQDNPATGKPHSASSAEKAAKETPEVKRLRMELLDAERLTIQRKARYECARIAAWASVAPVGAAA